MVNNSTSAMRTSNINSEYKKGHDICQWKCRFGQWYPNPILLDIGSQTDHGQYNKMINDWILVANWLLKWSSTGINGQRGILKWIGINGHRGILEWKWFNLLELKFEHKIIIWYGMEDKCTDLNDRWAY